MAKSEIANKVDQIQSEVYEHLKTLGYKKRGRTFNRVLNSGLIHVINFQMGHYPVGNHAEIPPFRYNLYGYFTINLGVFIPEVHLLTKEWSNPQFPKEYDCEIRVRIGNLLSPPGDTWFNLENDIEELSEMVQVLLRDHGLPYLERFLSQNDIIQEWMEPEDVGGLPHGSGLYVAILLANQGKVAQAKDLFLQETERKRNTGYSEFVQQIAGKMGISLQD